MNKVMESMERHVADNPPNYGDAHSILEMLFTYSHECNNTDSNAVKVAFEDLYQPDARHDVEGNGQGNLHSLHPPP